MRYIIAIAALFFISCTNQYKLFQTKLQDKNLFLESFGNLEESAPKNAIVVLSNGTFKGFGGCNDYNGVFTMNKDFIHFKLKDVGVKVCDDSLRESKYLKYLVKSTNIVIQGKKVMFRDSNDKNLLIFKRD
jgi:heat shock protein HslJ